MKLTNVTEVNDFLNTVNECKEDVYLTSEFGDKYNLKSKLSQYLGVAALIGEHGSELELWCNDPEDEARFIKFFHKNPDILG